MNSGGEHYSWIDSTAINMVSEMMAKQCNLVQLPLGKRREAKYGYYEQLAPLIHVITRRMRRTRWQ